MPTIEKKFGTFRSVRHSSHSPLKKICLVNLDLVSIKVTFSRSLLFPIPVVSNRGGISWVQGRNFHYIWATY